VPWQQLRAPSLPDAVRVAVTLDDFCFIFWLQTCLIGCFGSVVHALRISCLCLPSSPPHQPCTTRSRVVAPSPPKSCASPRTGAQCSSISVLRGGSWASPESWPSNTTLVFTSLNQTTHISSGCRWDFGAPGAPGTGRAPAPSQAPRAGPGTAQTSVPAPQEPAMV